MAEEITPVKRAQVVKEILALLDSKEISCWEQKLVLQVALKTVEPTT